MSTSPSFNIEIKTVFDFDIESSPVFHKFFPENPFILNSVSGIEYTGKFEYPCTNKFNEKEILPPPEIIHNHKILADRFIIRGKLRVHEIDLEKMKNSIPLRELPDGKRNVSSIPSVDYENVGNRVYSANARIMADLIEKLSIDLGQFWVKEPDFDIFWREFGESDWHFFIPGQQIKSFNVNMGKKEDFKEFITKQDFNTTFQNSSSPSEFEKKIKSLFSKANLLISEGLPSFALLILFNILEVYKKSYPLQSKKRTRKFMKVFCFLFIKKGCDMRTYISSFFKNPERSKIHQYYSMRNKQAHKIVEDNELNKYTDAANDLIRILRNKIKSDLGIMIKIAKQKIGYLRTT